MTTLLPNAKQQFIDGNGTPLAGGSVAFYVPGTTTPKNTWQDSSQNTLNTNPVTLDASGEAIIFGLGSYRQVVKDSLGNLIWDQLTASTDAGGIYSGGTSTGTAANQILATTSPAGFSLTAGNQLTFIAGFSSIGATTLNANGTGAKNIFKWGASGPVALSGGEIGVGDAVELFYDGTQYQLLNGFGGPSSAGDGNIALFNGTAGTVLKDSGVTPATLRVAIIGQSGNVKIVRASTTTLTVTYDELIEGTALGGTVYKAASGNFTFNGATNGANGMDTGSLPTSGYVAIYAITKGDGSTFATLGTTASYTTVYGGANMPTGYVASALIGIWPTDGSAHFPVGTQYGRKFWYQSPVAIFTGAAASATMTPRSLSAGVPAAAKTVDLVLGTSASGASSLYSVAADATGTGVQSFNAVAHIATADPIFSLTALASFSNVPLVTAQTVFWADADTNTNTAMYATSYTF